MNFSSVFLQPLAKQLAEAEEQVVKEMLECQVCPKVTISVGIEIVILFPTRELLSTWEDTSGPSGIRSPRQRGRPPGALALLAP